VGTKPTLLGAWTVATRPASFALAVGPVLVGAAMGYLRNGSIPLPLAGMALLGAHGHCAAQPGAMGLGATLLLLPTALRLVRDIRTCPGGRAYNALLFRVFRLELWFALALCAAALLTRL
jgi:1,4-dihydroxy-2-naphthoate octaprenyltransferase